HGKPTMPKGALPMLMPSQGVFVFCRRAPMNDKKTYLTPDGRQKLLTELDYLRTTRRAEVAAQIKFAKEGGDISENAGYDEAKNAQAFLEGRIMTIEQMIETAVIIDHEGPV